MAMVVDKLDNASSNFSKNNMKYKAYEEEALNQLHHIGYFVNLTRNLELSS